MDWGVFFGKIKNFFVGNVWNIIRFFAVLVIGLIVIKLLLTVFRKIFAKTKMEPVAQNFLLTTLKFVFWLILVLALLSVIGVELTGIITALSAAILAIGMALQSNISNVANGIVIVANKMFKKGDFIMVDGKEGSIVEINFLFTTINTPDNKRVTIPNSIIVNSSVVNAGANPKRRVNFDIPVAYESDVELVKKIVTSVMRSNGKVYLDPEPFCKLKTFNSSSIDFFAYCWCDSADYWEVYYYVTEHVYNEFKKHGVSIPYAQVEVRERKDLVTPPFDPSPLPERVEKDRPVSSRHFERNGVESLIEAPALRLSEIKKHCDEKIEHIAASRKTRRSNKTSK